jgi:hypothetical protein
MNLFHRRSSAPKRADSTVRPSPPAPAPAQKQGTQPREIKISLSAEQKSLLEKPIDPRVDRILQEIYSDRAAAEQALNSQRIIEFPKGDSGQGHVVQDENGFWRIVPGPASQENMGLLDAL